MGAVDDGLVIPPFRPSMGSGLGGTYAPESGGSRVGVSWDLNPRQLANRVFWVRVRSRGLKRELPSSLAALDSFIKARSGAR